MSFRVTFYDSRVESEILALPAGILARFIRYAERMEIFGPDLGMPHTRAMGGGLFELRLKAGERHHFIKKSPKTPHRDLDIARKRLEDLKHG